MEISTLLFGFASALLFEFVRKIIDIYVTEKRIISIFSDIKSLLLNKKSIKFSEQAYNAKINPKLRREQEKLAIIGLAVFSSLAFSLLCLSYIFKNNQLAGVATGIILSVSLNLCRIVWRWSDES